MKAIGIDNDAHTSTILTAEEWVEAVRNAKVPDEFAALDSELK